MLQKLGLIAGMAGALVACEGLDVSIDVNEIISENQAGAELSGGSKNGVCKMDIVRPPDEDGDPQDPIVCTCIVVAPDLVLTSALCVDDNLEAGTLNDITVGFGTDGLTSVMTGVTSVELHRYYDDENPNLFQLAIVKLPAVAPDLPLPLNDQDISDLQGEMAELVGFGEPGNDLGSFIRRAIELPISVVERETIRVGDDDNSNCDGDSGGPVLHDFGSGDTVIAVSRRQTTCSPTVSMTRTDRNALDFLFPYIDQMSGPCLADGNCVTVGCRTADPDCGDECLWGNTCREDCPTRDWDCPLGSFPGEVCAADGECEQGGRCVAAADDDTFLYCNKPCQVDEDCPQQMTCNDSNECEFGTPSPGSQGFACTQGDQCRSGICEDLICVRTCDPQNSDCPAEFTCGPSKVADGEFVCLGEDFSGGGGFCQAGSGRGTGTTAVLLLLALIWWRRRSTPKS